jgi:hypothetical protein
LLPAAENDDHRAVQHDDEERTFRAGFVVEVAAWSSWWRQQRLADGFDVGTVPPGCGRAKTS